MVKFLKLYIKGIIISLGISSGLGVFLYAWELISSVSTNDELTLDLINNVIEKVNTINYEGGVNEFSGLVKFSENTTSICDSSNKGVMKFSGDKFVGCNGTGWIDFIETAIEGGVLGIDDNTKLLIHFDGESDDAIGVHTVVNNNVTYETGKFNNAGSFNGTDKYLTVAASDDFDFSSSAFTIDFWFKINDLDYQHALFQLGHDSDGRSMLLRVRTDGALGLFATSTNTTWSSTSSDTGLITTDTWYHIAVTKESGTNPVKLYLNGNLKITTGSLSGLYYDSSDTDRLKIGAYYPSSSSVGTGPSPLDGNMDEFRVSKGIVRWNGTFDPPIGFYY